MRRYAKCVSIRGYWQNLYDRRLAVFVAVAVACGSASPASAQLVRITKLKNADFGTISSFGSDSKKNQNVCVYSSSLGGGYNVTATGSGSAGAFTLSGSSATLPYEVQWSGTSGQTSGTSLSPSVALTGQSSGALSSNCNVGPSTTASLIIVIRASEKSSATATSYSGTLTIMIGPE
ncbi:hypothetical protein [Sphingomonas sp.]|uniref:hypothetical protein n=1 Tax=Sphingomonas sp. TaxID=28214 RepID=UPI00307F7E71